MMRPFGLFPAIAINLLIALPAGAQPTTTRVPDEIACRTCRITITTVATPGDVDGPGEIASSPTGIRVDARGRYWVWMLEAFNEGQLRRRRPEYSTSPTSQRRRIV